MGQRLVVTVQKDERDICKIYYHWSAYSFSALLETQKIVNCIYNHKDETEKELLLRLIRFCEKSGGGIDGKESEFQYIQSLYPNEKFQKEDYSRNRGLIALSENGMDDMQKWSEGDVIIDIDEEKIYNGVFSYYESIDDYNDELKEYEDDFEPLTLDDIVDIEYDLSEIDIEDLDAVIETLRDVDGVCRYGEEIFDLTE